MGRVTIDEKDLNADGGELFAKLELDDPGEIARLWMPTDDGWSEWVHTIRRPVFERGEPVTLPADRKGGRDRYETDFVGQRICLGDREVMDQRRSDPANCPACAAAERNIAEGMAADLRYAFPVIRYACKRKDSDQVRTGDAAGGEMLVFVLTSRMYKSLLQTLGQMRDLLEIPEEKEIHLRFADVIVEREPGGPMRLKWLAPKRLALKADEGVKRFMFALWRDTDNRPTDMQLRARCGKEPDRGWMKTDVDYAEREWRKVRKWEDGGATADPLGGAAPGADKPLSADIDSLLGEDEDVNGNGEPDLGPDTAPARPASDDPLAGEEDLSGLGEFAPEGAASANGHDADDDMDLGPDSAPAAAAAEDADPLAGEPAEPARPAPAASRPAAAKGAPKAGAGARKPTKSFDSILGGDD